LSNVEPPGGPPTVDCIPNCPERKITPFIGGGGWGGLGGGVVWGWGVGGGFCGGLCLCLFCFSWPSGVYALDLCLFRVACSFLLFGPPFSFFGCGLVFLFGGVSCVSGAVLRLFCFFLVGGFGSLLLSARGLYSFPSFFFGLSFSYSHHPLSLPPFPFFLTSIFFFSSFVIMPTPLEIS